MSREAPGKIITMPDMKKPAMTFPSCFDILFLTFYDEHPSIFPIQENASNWEIWPLVFVIHLLFTKPGWAKVAFLLAEACIPIGWSSKILLMLHGLMAIFNAPTLHNTGSITILSHGRQYLSTEPYCVQEDLNALWRGLIVDILKWQPYLWLLVSVNIL